MRLLYLAPFLRVPPDYGGAIRAFHLVRSLAQKHRVRVITYDDGSKGNQLRAWAEAHLEQLILLPAPPRGRCRASRAAALRRLLVYPPEAYRRLPSDTLTWAVRRELARTPQPDLVIFETLMTAQVIHQIKPRVPAVLSLYDAAASYLWKRLSQLPWRPFKIMYGIEWLKVQRFETQIVRAFQNVVVVSRENGAAVKRMNPAARILHVPNGVDTRALVPAAAPRGSAILLVGSFDHAPNVEGLWYFYEEILPLIRAQRSARLLVVGRNPPPQFVKAARRDPDVEIAANVPDMRPYYARARVSVVPLLSGEGTRLKILEAFSLGVPVVATRVGAEGLELGDADCLLLADNAVDFAAQVLALCRDDARADELARNARGLVEARYDWEMIGRNYRAELELCAAG